MLSRLHSLSPRLGAVALAAMLASYLLAAPATAAEPAADQELGRIDFKQAELPPANVELDLSPETFANLFGIGDAAVAGIAEALNESASTEHSEATEMAAEQLAAVRQVLGLSGQVIREVRVRAYEDMSEDLSLQFNDQLREGNWEKIAVLRKDEDQARVYVISKDNAIRGAFIVAAGDGGQALVNVVCDISPENVKKLSAAATKIGLKNGLQRELDIMYRQMQRQTTAPPQPPETPKTP